MQNKLDLALNITGRFEGRGFHQVTGNFDGQGISVGILQWNVGQKTLQQKILKPYQEKYGNVDSFFPKPIFEPLTSKGSLSWTIANMIDGGKVKMDWHAAWAKFLSDPRTVEVQKEACADISLEAEKISAHLGLTSNRAYCWSFDIVTQNGGLKGLDLPEPKTEDAMEELATTFYTRTADFSKNKSIWMAMVPALSDEQKSLLILSCKRAKLVKAEFMTDVINRKGTIAVGRGWVHQELFTFEL